MRNSYWMLFIAIVFLFLDATACLFGTATSRLTTRIIFKIWASVSGRILNIFAAKKTENISFWAEAYNNLSDPSSSMAPLSLTSGITAFELNPWCDTNLHPHTVKTRTCWVAGRQHLSSEIRQFNYKSGWIYLSTETFQWLKIHVNQFKLYDVSLSTTFSALQAAHWCSKGLHGSISLEEESREVK